MDLDSNSPSVEGTIETMGESDLDEVVAMDNAIDLSPWSRSSFLGEIGQPCSSCFVLRGGPSPTEPLIGYLCFRTFGEDSELLKLGVHPENRRRGYGRQLMRFYTDYCQSRGVRTFHLETGVSNKPAIRLYRSFSYRPAGIRPRFFPNGEDALLMTRRVLPPPEASVSPPGSPDGKEVTPRP